jgi:archaellum component FlaC
VKYVLAMVYDERFSCVGNEVNLRTTTPQTKEDIIRLALGYEILTNKYKIVGVEYKEETTYIIKNFIDNIEKYRILL